MADVKISALPAATTPLAGTEVLPIVQSATTKQVAVADLTAGRAMSATSLTLTTPLSAANGGTGLSSLGTGVATALGVNTGTAGAFVVNGGALGTPSSGTLTNCTGIPAAGVTGTLPVANGGTGLTSLTAGYIPYGNGTGAFGVSKFWTDGTNTALGNSFAYDFLDIFGSVTMRGALQIFAGSVLMVNGSGGAFGGYNVSNGQGQGAFAANSYNVELRNISTNTAANMLFYTSNTERMRIAADGSVGIGTTSPGSYGKLAVVSGSEIATYISGSSTSAWSASSSNGTLSVANTAVGNNSTCLFNAAVNYGDSTYASVKFGAVASASYSADFVVANRNVGTYQENLRLTSAGNLGLGVTPSAWGGGKALEVGGAGSGLWWYGSTSLYNTMNCRFDGTSWKYGATGQASLYLQSAGSHIWNTAASGSAGGTISFTQAMTLDSSGNLLVGTTTYSASTNANYLMFNPVYGQEWISHASGTVNGTAYTNYTYNGTTIGYINQNGTTGVLYNTSSDISLKSNITEAVSALASVLAIPIRQFDWKSDGSHTDYGVVAQEANEYAPEMVTQGELWSVDYGRITPRLIKAFQELAAEVAMLKGQLNG